MVDLSSILIHLPTTMSVTSSSSHFSSGSSTTRDDAQPLPWNLFLGSRLNRYQVENYMPNQGQIGFYNTVGVRPEGRTRSHAFAINLIQLFFATESMFIQILIWILDTREDNVPFPLDDVARSFFPLACTRQFFVRVRDELSPICLAAYEHMNSFLDCYMQMARHALPPQEDIAKVNRIFAMRSIENVRTVVRPSFMARIAWLHGQHKSFERYTTMFTIGYPTQQARGSLGGIVNIEDTFEEQGVDHASVPDSDNNIDFAVPPNRVFRGIAPIVDLTLPSDNESDGNVPDEGSVSSLDSEESEDY